MNKYLFNYRKCNSVSWAWHEETVEAETEAEAWIKMTSKYSDDYDISIVRDDIYGDDELLQIDPLT